MTAKRIQRERGTSALSRVGSNGRTPEMWCRIRSSNAPPTNGIYTLQTLANRNLLPASVSVRK